MIKHLGAMIDCSRNSVPSVDAVKKFIDLLSKIGYDFLELYTEDTWEVEGEPRFGICRGRYTKAELREIDAYAAAHGMTLRPCIQTLAHLGSIFRWPEYQKINDTADILLVGDEGTYTLIENMFKTLAETFTTRTVHIGMDEAWMLGHGKYYKRNGEVARQKIMQQHLLRVLEIADKYGFECEMWGDMFYEMAYGTIGHGITQEDVKAAIPANVKLIYWDYYQTDAAKYDTRFDNYLKLTPHVGFAGGAWTWTGFCPDNKFSLKATESAFRSCESHGIDEALLTLWGDDGGECSLFAVLPTLVAASEFAKGNYDMNKIAKVFRRVVGMDMDVFMSLDLPDKLSDSGFPRNPSKFLLYNDPFIGLQNRMVKEGDGKFYDEIAEKIAAGKGSRTWGYLFKMEEVLARLLAVKCDLSLKTRRLYKEGDREALATLIPTYRDCIKRVRVFYRTLEEYWMHDKKPFGFEIQDLRLGGLANRLDHCARLLSDYCRGKTDVIPELEEPPVEAYDAGQPGAFYLCNWKGAVSANVLHH